MSSIINTQVLKEQYKTAENLKARGNLHSYNTNKTDWNIWCFNEMKIPSRARILELGCGTGEFWNKNRQNLNDDWDVTLSDFSNGMLESTKDTLEPLHYNFDYKEINAEHIPYEDESFDVVIARHMLYLVPDIEKALSEIERVLVKGGRFYATTNAGNTMAELNKLMEEFDPEAGLNTNGMCGRFDFEQGQLLLKKHFNEVEMSVLQGEIVVDEAEPVVSYKASTIKGKSVLVGEKRQQFTRFIENYIIKNGHISITTKACIFKAKK